MNKLTDIVGRYHAIRFDVCKQGGLVAFHFATSHGKVIVTAGLDQFMENCRGPRDSNHNRFPEYVPPAGAALVEGPRRPARKLNLPYRSRMPAEQLARYEAAAADVRANRYPTTKEAAAAHGITSTDAFQSWYYARRAEAEAAAANAREPITKPGGKLL